MKKILLISHLPISTDTNVGKTLFNLFSGYPKEKISQIYFTESGDKIPGVNYLYIDELLLLKSFLNINKKSTKVEGGHNKSRTRELIYNKLNLRSPLALLMRDLLWRFSMRDSSKIYCWLDSINPDIIFLAPGYSIFTYRMACNFSKHCGARIVTYFMEDFYNERRFSLSPFFWIRYDLFRGAVKKCVKESALIFTINESLTKDYKSLFKKDVFTLFNPSPYLSIPVSKKGKSNMFSFFYGGNVGIGRIDVLLEIGRVIELLNSEGFNAQLLLYGEIKSESIINSINSINSIHYGGAISSDELVDAIANSDCLLHVESFEKKYIAKTRKAFSTKIPEYLSSGKLIVAVGPNNIESVNYLYRTKSAVIVDNIEFLYDKLKAILENRVCSDVLIKQAEKISQINHNPQTIQTFLYNQISKI